MTMVKGLFSGLFGVSHNDRYTDLMNQLAAKASECASHFTATNGRDLDSIIAFERQGDALVDQVHEVLDNSFILRFDIPDAMRLADELDNVLDGLRKTAMHIDIHRAQLTADQADVVALGAIAESMIAKLGDIVAMLREPRIRLATVRKIVSEIDRLETEADEITALAERRLVGEYAPAGANRLEFLAWKGLYTHLEEATDHANHCAKLVLSLARREA